MADRGNRYYVVSPEYTFDFLPEFRKFRDQFDREISIRPWTSETGGGFCRLIQATLPVGSEPGDEGVQYRVVHYPGGGAPILGE